MNRSARSIIGVALLLLAMSVIACAGGMNLAGKTPIVGTIRLAPTASCPVPTAVATTTATTASTATADKGGKK